ncbi:MAG: hypothetical protein H0U50_05555 [Pyrinomonadaceae bacterium]|nr:hypothetical protein [Pyrinomonadaceae bacterium]
MDEEQRELIKIAFEVTYEKTIEKVLGPTLDDFGEDLKRWTVRRKGNLARILENAWKKLGSKTETYGQVNSRVLKGILSEGTFYDDQLMAEYFGGVLASSRSEVSRDDRGASFVALIGRLTTYQIRAHYIFYNTVKTLFDGRTDVSVISAKYRNKLETFISNDSFNFAMEFSEKENVSVILPSVMSGLARENLIERDFEVMGGEKTTRCGGNGIVFCPTDLGTELFLWVHGKNDISVTEFLKPEHTFSFETNIQLPKSYKSVDKILTYRRELQKKLKPEF